MAQLLKNTTTNQWKEPICNTDGAQYVELVSGAGSAYTQSHKESSVGTGTQVFEITPTVGTNWYITKISVYCQGAAVDALFQVARGTVGSYTVIGSSYYASSRSIDNVNDALATTGLIVEIDHGNVAAQDVYVTIEYKYT